MFTSILQLPFQPRKQFALLTNRHSLPLVAAIIVGGSLLHTFIANYLSLGTNQSSALLNAPELLVLAALFGVAALFVLPLLLKGTTSMYDHSLSYQKAFWVNILTAVPSLFLLPVALIGLFLFLGLGNTPTFFTGAYRVLEWLTIIWAFVVGTGMIQVAANTSRARSLTIVFTYFCFTLIAFVLASLLLGGFYVAF